MIYGYFGTIGTGKTLGAVIHAYREYRNKNKTVYSTMPLNFPHQPVKTVKDFLSAKRGILLGDELWFLIDSRYSGSNRNNILSAVLLRSRKQMLNIIYTEQHFTQIDIRIRRNTEFFISSSITPYFEDIDLAKRYVETGGTFSLDQNIFNQDGLLIDTRFYSNVNPYFSLYDTDVDPYIISDTDIIRRVEDYEKKSKKDDD